ncbi:MAG: apolipoprotein N-acyltransferase [Candidatus Omnitrophica bacterium CG1_02_49_10]|nr:MAG: apolipoprotein N-acyltransferase [Candidatus Omnitrophica bacterium CG1_02_49_10]
MNAPLSGDKFRVSVIQGNIHQGEKWDSSLKNEIFAKYERLTLEALLDKPDLIIWPETSFPGFPEEETLFIDKLAFLSKKMRADILIGAPTFADPGGYKFYNSAILIDKDNGICMQYDKAHLVPFGEYLPFERILGFVRGFSSRPIGDFEGGDEYTVFESGSRRFGVLICFEDIFPGLVRNFTRANPDFMVNITNDAWFMRSSAPYQHAQASVLRAVENRVSFVRSANTGLSCFIDPKGRITEAVSKDEKEIFVDGFRTAEVPAGPRTSFYRRHGDIFAIGSMFLALALAVRKIII